ncbi:hypothetical protein [Streptomyces sp. NPDC001530]
MRHIQKTIQLEKPTATIDWRPQNASWASKDIWEEVKVSAAPEGQAAL